MFAQLLASGITFGLLIAVISLAMSLIFGVMGIVNFAHGDLLMAAMYLAYWLYRATKWDPLLLTPVTAAAMAVVFWIIFRLIIRRLLNAGSAAQIFATFGLSILLEGAALMVFGPNLRAVQPTIMADPVRFWGISLAGPDLLAALVSVGAVAALFLLLRTEFGVKLRACAQDREAAMLMGIDVRRMYAATWVIAGLLVAVGATLLERENPVTPTIGLQYAVLSFVAIALGGFTSITGTLFAALAIGIVSSFAGFYWDGSLSMIPVYFVFLVALRWRAAWASRRVRV